MLSERHLHVDENGVGLCSVRVFRGGLPGGFCNEPAYGEQTEEGKLKCKDVAVGLACPAHGGPQPPRSNP